MIERAEFVCPNCNAKKYDILDEKTRKCRCQYCGSEWFVDNIGTDISDKPNSKDYLFHCLRIALCWIFIPIISLYIVSLGLRHGGWLLSTVALISLFGGIEAFRYVPKIEGFLYKTAPERRRKRELKRMKK